MASTSERKQRTATNNAAILETGSFRMSSIWPVFRIRTSRRLSDDFSPLYYANFSRGTPAVPAASEISFLIWCNCSTLSGRLRLSNAAGMRREVQRYILSSHRSARSCSRSRCRDALACRGERATLFAAEWSETPLCTHGTFQRADSTKIQLGICLA
jgi:hypothetical protein